MAPSHKLASQRGKGKKHRRDGQQQQLQEELQISSHPVNPFETGIGCDRYGLLEIDQALWRRGDYVRACQELALLLRTAYDLLSKSAQAAVFEDVLTAFQQLPQSGGSRQKAVAVVLVRAAQAVLPKQRKMIAVSEFRRTSLANHRTLKRGKQLDDKCNDNDSDSSDEDILEISHLPMDVVAHVLDYLDPPSLVAVSAVCRSFRELSASNEELWEAHFRALFGLEAADTIEREWKDHKEEGGGEERGGRMLHPSRPGLPVGDRRAQWRKAFERAACRGDRASFLSSNRAYCATCNILLWISSPKLVYATASPDNRDDTCTSELQTSIPYGCPRLLHSRGKQPHQHTLYPLSPEEVVLFLKDGCLPKDELLSDSDSNEEQGSAFRLWAPPSIH